MKSIWSAISREYPSVNFNFLDCTNDDGIALSYDTDTLPALLVVDEENKILGRLIGINHKDIVIDFLKKYNFI
jgi:hypothetical protein